MARSRRVPDDQTLQRIFRKHPGWVAQDFLNVYGWPASRALVRAHRRRLLAVNPIRGAASMSRDQFRATLDEQAQLRHWATTS